MYLRLWLIILFILIILMVAVGGLTRLTDSGLSITAWELFTGIFPPINQIEWNNYFSEYKKIPEFKDINFNMTLDEFKVIFYWEYAHRLFSKNCWIIFIITSHISNRRFRNNKFYSNKYYLIFLLVFLKGLLVGIWFQVV